MSRAPRRAILFGLAALFAAGVAHADDKRVAAGHFRAGSALYDRGDYTSALSEFEAGFAAFPLAAFHVNLGQCYRKLLRFDEAAHEYARFLDSGAGDAALREEVREALAETRAEAARAEEKRAAAPPPPAVAPAPSVARAAPAPAPARPVAPRLAPALVVSVPPAALEPLPAPALAARKKSRWWLWTIVGVAAAGAVAASAAVAIIETQPGGPRAGSLGLLDGRR